MRRTDGSGCSCRCSSPRPGGSRRTSGRPRAAAARRSSGRTDDRRHRGDRCCAAASPRQHLHHAGPHESLGHRDGLRLVAGQPITARQRERGEGDEEERQAPTRRAETRTAGARCRGQARAGDRGDVVRYRTHVRAPSLSRVPPAIKRRQIAFIAARRDTPVASRSTIVRAVNCSATRARPRVPMAVRSAGSVASASSAAANATGSSDGTRSPVPPSSTTFGQSVDGGGDHRHSRRHRLQSCVRRGLPPGRHAEDVRCRDQVLRVVAPAEQLDAAVGALRDAFLERPELCTGPDDVRSPRLLRA